MAMKEQPKAIYRTMQGKEVDLNRLMNQNELTMAVGNVKVNARGDELGAGGKIVRKREELLRETDVPNQINIRPKKEVEVVEKAGVKIKKDVLDMDPEGNE
jgi:hypothetical protein